MNKKMKMCSMLLGLALFAACSSDDDVATPQPKTYPLTIEVSENPLIPEGGAANAPATRAAITTTETLTAFRMDYVYNNSGILTGQVNTSKVEGEKWESDNSWPNPTVEPDLAVDWYAWRGSLNDKFLLDTNNKPYINFEVEEAPLHQNDLLVATPVTKRWSECNGHLKFTFDHACSAIRLYAKKAKNIETYSLSISKIVLCNVIKQGVYKYDNSSWSWGLGNDRAEYTLYEGSSVALNDVNNYVLLNGTEENAFLFMIPQSLTTWTTVPTDIPAVTTQSYLKIEYSLNGAATSTGYIPFAAEFKQGKWHDIKINIGKNSFYNANGTNII